MGRILGEFGATVIDMPNKFAIGDANHKWGRLSFHYTQPATEWVADQNLAKTPLTQEF